MRIQFELSQEKTEELERLMKKSSLSTRKDLFNNALTLFEWAVKEREAGRIIASVDEANESFRELQMPVFENVIAKPGL